MVKKILKMLLRIVIISALLYGSYYLYTRHTGFAIQMIDYEKLLICLIVHSLLSFFIGIALRFDTGLITSIRNKTVKVNFVTLGAGVFFLVVLVILIYRCFYMHISCFVALAAGYFLIESFEHNNQQNN